MAKCKRNRNRAKRNFTFKTPAANRKNKPKSERKDETKKKVKTKNGLTIS